MKEGADKDTDLTERIILLEKAANQLEEDNKHLAGKLRESLSLCESNDAENKHEIQRLKC